MRLEMMVSLGMLGMLAIAGCQSSHPTTKPSHGGAVGDDSDCCKTAALAPAGAAALQHAGQTAYLAVRVVDADGTASPSQPHD